MTSIDANGRELFMSITVALGSPDPEQCFEEIRIQDYLKAYKTTGQPPTPCPQEPVSDSARAAINLAPLFQPVPVDASCSDSAVAEVQCVDVPSIHIFEVTRSSSDEQLHSISAQAPYNNFSHEELRCQAYLSGNISPPSSILPSAAAAPVATATADPRRSLSQASSSTHAFFATDSASTAFTTSNVAPGPPEYFMSVSASPKYDRHAFEELRIAFLVAGREMTSQDLLPVTATIASTSTTSSVFQVASRPRGDAFSMFTPLRP